MTYETQKASADALEAEGWLCIAPSSSTVAVVKALKLAASIKPADTDDIEYDLRCDWLTDNVMLKSYHKGKRVSFVCCIVRSDIEKWHRGAMSERELKASIEGQWKGLTSVFDDQAHVFHTRRDQHEGEAKVRTPYNMRLM